MWTIGKSKKLKKVRFFCLNLEELYSVGLIGRRLESRARGDAAVGTAWFHPWCHLGLPKCTGKPSVFRGQIPCCQLPSLLQLVLKVEHLFSGLLGGCFLTSFSETFPGK